MASTPLLLLEAAGRFIAGEGFARKSFERRETRLEPPHLGTGVRTDALSHGSHHSVACLFPSLTTAPVLLD